MDAMPSYRSRHRLPYLLFGALLLLDTSSFLLDKLASKHAVGTGAQGVGFYLTVLKQPWIWGGFLIAPFQLLTYTRILKNVDLSLAYPITALAVPLTMLVSQFGLREHLTAPVWAGALLITCGVGVLGHHSAPKPTP